MSVEMDVKTDSPTAEKGEKFVPLKDRPALSHKPALAPWACPGLRDKMYKWYPGPTVLMHKMHWTEWIFVLFDIAALVFFLIGPESIDPVSIFGILICIVSAISFIMVWGIAKYKTLADAAEKLEKVAMANHAEVGVYEGINDEWEDALKDSQGNLDQFAHSLGMVEDDANAINELTECLQAMVATKKKIQAEEKALFQVSLRHQKCTRDEINEKNRQNMKKQLSRLYDRCAKKNGGIEVDSPEEITQLKHKLIENEFLNQKKLDADGNPTKEAMFNWEVMFDEIADDGKIQKWELLDALDVMTCSFFIEIRDAMKTRDGLRAELTKLTAGRPQKEPVEEKS